MSIQFDVRLAMGIALILGVLLMGFSLFHLHKDPKQPSLADLITATDRSGTVRMDARKLFECGAFCASTWAFVFIVVDGKLTEWFFTGYMGAWVLARFLRDREQRLSTAKATP